MKKALITTLVAIALSACGGGGEDSPSASVTGTYAVTLAKQTDTCNAFGQYNGANHIVTADGSGIVLQMNSATLRGGVTPEGGLTASEDKISASGRVTSRLTITYSLPSGVSPPGNGSFNVLLSGEVASGNVACLIRYVGTATKIA